MLTGAIVLAAIMKSLGWGSGFRGAALHSILLYLSGAIIKVLPAIRKLTIIAAYWPHESGQPIPYIKFDETHILCVIHVNDFFISICQIVRTSHNID